MEKSALKKRLLAACISKQQSLINNFRKRIESLLVVEGLGNEESYDNNDLSNTSLQVDEASGLTEALHFAEDEMKQLRFIQLLPETMHTKVEPGSVVVTNNSTFFISVSIEQFNVEGEPYVGLSVHSPLFIAMKGKPAGETFSYGGREYRIEDIF